MKLIVGILLAVLATTDYANAQRGLPPISLSQIKKDINEIETPDEKLRTYIELSNRYFRNAPDSLLAVAHEIEALEGISEDQKEAFTSFINANAYRLLNADSATYYAERAADKLLQLDEHDSYLMMENLRAMQYARKDQYLEAESLYLSAISYREELEEEVQYPIQYFYGNLGNLYVRVEAHDLAVEAFQKFLEYEDNPAARCNILSKMATSFLQLESYDKALATITPCLEYENLPPPIKSMIRSNISSIYERKGDIATAIQFLEQSSEISRKHRIPNITESHLVRLGNLYIQQAELAKADSMKSFLVEPVVSFSRPNEQIVKLHFFTKLAFEKKEYERSIAYAQQAIDLAKQHKLEKNLRDTYAIRSAAHENLGQVDKALEYERLQRLHDEEMADFREDWSNNMLTVRYQLQNKEAELVDANLKLENIRIRNFLIIIGVILIAGYIFYRYRVHYLLKEEKTRNQIARDLHDDLSGTLSSISFFSEAARRVQSDPNESKRFLSIIDESADEAKEKINDIIWAIDPSKDDWSSFLKKCKRFASDLLDSANIEYELEISDDITFPMTLEIRQNLWLIFKECITNLSKYSEAEKAKIIFKKEKNILLLKVCDDGKGFDPEELNNGNGLKNIRYRANAIGGKASLETAPGEGTIWTFEFEQ